MNATFRTVVWGTLPLGALLGGALGGVVGFVPTMLAGAVICTIAVAPLCTSPIRELRAYSSVMSAADDG